MKYADSKCLVQETFHPEHIYVFTGKCIFCDANVEVQIKALELCRYRGGAKIQDALRSNNEEEREFLISGICNVCFDEFLNDE